jgi:hypothetical protein
VVQPWLDAGVQGRAIYAAFILKHGYMRSYSAVLRMLRHMRKAAPSDIAVRLSSLGLRMVPRGP